MYFLRVLKFSLILIAVFSSENLETLTDLKIYDAAQINLGTVMGEVEIKIVGYPETPEFLTAALTLVQPSNLQLQKHEFIVEADKVIFRVWPMATMLLEKNTFTIQTTIELNDASSAAATFTFYKIDIETYPAMKVGESAINLVYDERMNDEEKAETAISCTFQDKADNGVILASGIQHLASEAVLLLQTGAAQKVSVNFGKMKQMEKKKDEEEEEQEKDEIYGCGFEFAYGDQTAQFGREFTVEFKPDGRNWGAIIAAIVIACLILLLIIAFIVYRCCCVKRKEKQIPPNLKTSRSPVQETNLSSPETHPKFNDAVNFLDNVQIRFEKQPDIYRTFLNTLTEFRSKKISKPDLARKVEILFEGHPDLVTGFNDFLRSRKKNAHENAGNEYTVVDIQVKKNPAANGSDKETADKAVSPESHPKFNAASQFVDRVQSTFVDQPEVYKTFLRILNDFKPKKMNKSDLRAEIDILFAGHPDLLEGFNDFISSKKKKSLPENEYVVIDTQGNKKGEVHANKGVAEGTV